MDNRIKEAFEPIQAEPALKATTHARLHAALAQEVVHAPRRSLPSFRAALRTAVALSCLVCLLFAGRAYNTTAAYVDLEINPSVALSVNRFDRVIAATAYNADGEALLSAASVQHQRVDAALEILLSATAAEWALQPNDLVSVTVATAAKDRAPLANDIEAQLSRQLTQWTEYHTPVQLDIFTVDTELRTTACEQHRITPAKYLAILDLQETDPEATIEGCKNHTVTELQTQAQQNRTQTRNRHRGGHGQHGNGAAEH